MHLLPLAAIVCGAWFTGLSHGWHQSSPSATLLSHGVTETNTFSWAANFRPSNRFGLARGFPSNGVYVWVSLDRTERRIGSGSLRLPLRLRDAGVLVLAGTADLPEYRFDGWYGRQYHVLAGVDFGRPRPTRQMRKAAAATLRALVLPRWVPRPQRCRG
jgi:hypothetical protein